MINSALGGSSMIEHDKPVEVEAVEYSPFDYAVHEDPYPIYRVLREQAPVYHNTREGLWVLSRHRHAEPSPPRSRNVCQIQFSTGADIVPEESSHHARAHL
jgi:hypothetical protein